MRSRVFGFAPFFMGTVLLYDFSRHPSLEAANRVEISALVLSGFLFAVALAFFFGKLQRPNK